jgi:hypothetical protein
MKKKGSQGFEKAFWACFSGSSGVFLRALFSRKGLVQLRLWRLPRLREPNISCNDAEQITWHEERKDF